MPPLPRIRTDALARLADGLEDAPRAALLADIERAEALAAELEIETQYPIDWIVFRLTGQRPDLPETPLVPGEALLGDLSALVERLCDAARLEQSELPPGSATADALAERWAVSRKTIDRWRRRGLIARRVREGKLASLRITPAAARAFAARNAELITRAGGFSRIDEATEKAMLRRAARYRDLLGCSLNQSAERLAARYGRSREAVRQILQRHDAAARAGGGEPTFDESGPLREKSQRAIERAWRRGIEPGDLVRRYERTRGAIHRIVNEQRLRRLAALDLGRTAPAAALDGEGMAALLASAPLRSLEPLPVPLELTALLAMMRERVVPVGVEERARARAEHALRARAARAIAEASPHAPEARLVDRAETDLRWAAALRAALARTQLRLLVETLQDSLGIDLDHTRADEAAAIIGRALGTLRLALDHYDPWKTGRLASPVGIAAARLRLDRAAEDAPGPRRRAQVRLLPGAPAPDWTLLVSPWAAAVRPDRRLAEARRRIDPDLAALLAERYGLAGSPPRTLAEIAAARRITIMHAGRLERRAIRAALAAARAGDVRR